MDTHPLLGTTLPINLNSQDFEGKLEEDEKPKPKIVLWKFVFIAYFLLCGGPYGIEEAVGAGYPLFTLLFTLIIPIIFSTPVACITAELGTMLNTDEGLVEWINAAFGPRFAFVFAATDWVSGIIDMAIYPVLFLSYVDELAPDLYHNVYFHYSIPGSMVLLVVIFNLLGIHIMGSLSMIFTIIVISPSFVFLVWAGVVGDIHPSDWIALPPGNLSDKQNISNIAICFNIMFWCFGGAETLGNMIEELDNSDKNFSRALLGTNFLTVATYIIALVGTIGIQRNWSDWEDGYFGIVAFELGGTALKYIVIFAAMVSSFATLNASLAPTSQGLWALGDSKYLNFNWLKWKHPYFNTPWPSILINGLVVGILTYLPFVSLVTLHNAQYAIIVIAMCACIIRLRIAKVGSTMTRPYKTAESTVGVVLVCSMPVIVCLYILGSAMYNSPYLVLWMGGIYVVLFIVHAMLLWRTKCTKIK